MHANVCISNRHIYLYVYIIHTCIYKKNIYVSHRSPMHTCTYVLQQLQGSSKTELQVGWCLYRPLLVLYEIAWGVTLASDQTRRDWGICYRSPPFYLTCIWRTEKHFGNVILLAWPDSTPKEMCHLRAAEGEDGSRAGGRQPRKPRGLVAPGWLKAPTVHRFECSERRSCNSVLPETSALGTRRGNSSDDPATVRKWKMLKCSGGWLLRMTCKTPDGQKDISSCPRKTFVKGFMLKRGGKERTNC